MFKVLSQCHLKWVLLLLPHRILICWLYIWVPISLQTHQGRVLAPSVLDPPSPRPQLRYQALQKSRWEVR